MSRQRRPGFRVGLLAAANECLDDLQGGACFAFGALALEIRGELFVRAKDFLIVHRPLAGVGRAASLPLGHG